MMHDYENLHGMASLCRHCGKAIHCSAVSAWNGVEYELLDRWWSHFVHPADDHDGEPPRLFLPERY
ncbi:hypothetical protein SEA_MOLLYMUR_58 [Gordonia phage Mollymur]|uniref:Uncharacterized protein n=1 Tax=Gordonia phage Mollymur TaxID=2590895 RepID=A0A4Y6EKS0_9CAUD|nr:hypothetical protein PQB84_gp067 [Gordonia phage Mollymur]QDF15419.1 hypothetical protein SEA_MOLLYMUR_58 [Gordonia phage Mollymur]